MLLQIAACFVCQKLVSNYDFRVSHISNCSLAHANGSAGTGLFAGMEIKLK
jgi:hypothetical protein